MVVRTSHRGRAIKARAPELALYLRLGGSAFEFFLKQGEEGGAGPLILDEAAFEEGAFESETGFLQQSESGFIPGIAGGGEAVEVKAGKAEVEKRAGGFQAEPLALVGSRDPEGKTGLALVLEIERDIADQI